MKKLILLLLTMVLLSCNTATKIYKIYPFIPSVGQHTINGQRIPFKTLGLYPGDYGMYTDSSWMIWEDDLYMTTKKLDTPITIDWVTLEQIKWNNPVHPFYFTTGGVISVEKYRPPFHIQVKCNFLYRSDILESVWLLNNNEADSTRELDLFESGNGNWGNRLWCADHFAGPLYENRAMNAVELIFPPDSINQVDIFVFKNHALRYINGKLIKETIANLDYEYNILVTMIVCDSTAREGEWYLDKIQIEKLK